MKTSDIFGILVHLGTIFGIFLLILGIIIIIYDLYIYRKIIEINTWPVLPNAATIISSEVESVSSGSSINFILFSSSMIYHLHRNRSSFAYIIDNKQYVSTTMSYYEPWYADISFAYIQHNLYEPGKTFDLIINPNNPAEAYVKNYAYGEINYVLGILSLIAGGIFLHLSKPYH